MRLIIVLVCLTAVFNSSCKKIFRCEGKGQLHYTFNLPVSITPQKDTFAVGDTIWIENIFSTQLKNEANGKTYDVSKVDFQPTLGIVDLNTLDPAYSYINPLIFDIYGHTELDNQATKYQAAYIHYDMVDGQFKYKIAFVVDKAGFYLIIFYSLRDGVDVDITECPNEDMSLKFTTNNNAPNNIYMKQYSKADYYRKYSTEQYQKEGCFIFYVK